MNMTPLSDSSAFRTISGLWTGKKGPLIEGHVIRSTNFRKDGLLDYSNIAELEVEERAAATRELEALDIIIERSGGGPKQPVGRIGLFVPPDPTKHYFTSNFTTALRVVDQERFDPLFVSLFMQALYSSGATETLQRATTGIRNLDWTEYLNFAIPEIDIAAQRLVASGIDRVRQAYRFEEQLIALTQELKRATMRVLFTRGLRGEVEKDSEIGPIPESWDVVRLGSLGRIGNGSTPKRSVPSYWEGGTYPWLTSSKVYDREIEAADQFVTDQALSECHLPKIQPGAVLIAITGQGKTLGHCAVLKIEASTNQHVAYLATDLSRADPSFVRGYIETQYDYLRQVGGGGGSTKGALTCAFLRSLPIPFPSTLAEQQEVSATLDSIDAKIDLHKRKKAVLEELFRALLHNLMTGRIRVADLDMSALETKQEVAA